MKRFLLGILFLLFNLQVFAQDRDFLRLVRDADNYFKYEQYNAAIPLYEQALELSPDNPEVNFNLAESYRNTFRYDDAEIYYDKVGYLSGKQNPMSFYYLALMKKYNGKYAESIQSFDDFLDLTDGTGRYPMFTEQAFIEQAGARNALDDKSEMIYSAEPLVSPVNSPFNDFASAHLNENDILITSGRSVNKKNVDDRYGEAFTDLFYFTNHSEKWEDISRTSVRQFNMKYNEGSGVYNHNRNVFYYTVCGDERPECMVYVSYRDDKGNWKNPEPLNDQINRPGYDSKQPSISLTGDSLFFVSDRPGGHGGNDIWLSISDGGDHWGPAFNLGESVNTSLDEVSPLAAVLPNILLFASDGHQGYGGFDIYMARRLSTGDTSMINIGKPFNSSRDELYPEVYGKNYFWSSNRPGGQGQFDIYSSETGTAIKFLSRLSVLSKSAKRSDVDLTSRKPEMSGNDLLTIVTEDKLEYEELPSDEQQIVDKIVRDEKVEDLITDMSLGKQHALKVLAQRRKSLLDNTSKVLITQKLPVVDGINAYNLTGILVSSDNTKITNTRLYLKDERNEIVMIAGVSDNGTFRFSGIKSGMNVRIEADPFIYNSIDDLAVEDLHVSAISTKVQILENIYFDLDRYQLRPEAMKALAGLADHLKEYPDTQLEIFAYADNSGSMGYNLMLTIKRAQSVFDFLKSTGVAGDQLMIRPQGQEFPTSSKQDAFNRQLSRRVEFKIHQLNETWNIERKVCFINEAMPSTQLVEILEKLGVNQENIEILNGELDPNIRANQPFRLPNETKESPEITCPVIHQP